ncbi:unnamed protein product [Gadus morhua 'NCC']
MWLLAQPEDKGPATGNERYFSEVSHILRKSTGPPGSERGLNWDKVRWIVRDHGSREPRPRGSIRGVHRRGSPPGSGERAALRGEGPSAAEEPLARP